MSKKEGSILGFGITIDVEEARRGKAYFKHRKIKRSGRFEFMKEFDKRIYNLGLEVIENGRK